MIPFSTVGNASSLLMDRCRTESRCGGLDLIGLVWFSLVHVVGPDLAFSDQAFVLDAVLVDQVVVTTGEESAFILNNLKTPSLTVVVRSVNQLLVTSINVHCLNLTVVVTDDDLSIKDIDS